MKMPTCGFCLMFASLREFVIKVPYNVHAVSVAGSSTKKMRVANGCPSCSVAITSVEYCATNVLICARVVSSMSLSIHENQAVSPEISIAHLYHKRLVPNSQVLGFRMSECCARKFEFPPNFRAQHSLMTC